MDSVVSVLYRKRDGQIVLAPGRSPETASRTFAIVGAEPGVIGERIAALLAELPSDRHADHVVPSSQFAAEFRRAEVSAPSGTEYWRVTLYNYDPKTRTDIPDGEHRLRRVEGHAALAEMILALLDT